MDAANRPLANAVVTQLAVEKLGRVPERFHHTMVGTPCGCRRVCVTLVDSLGVLCFGVLYTRAV